MRRALVLILVAFAALAAAPSLAAARSPIPVLAYYYIWFNTSSWDRAKRDYPLLGRYASDEQQVMRTHIRQAKAAGIDGFLVSWKDTPVLDRRLTKLIEVAKAENFKLGIVYQGLDFYRRPQRAGDVAADLSFFIRRFSHETPFRVFGDKPVVIWSGTWEYSPQQVAKVTRLRRSRLQILASEKNAREYQRLRGLVDGNAYYWSSVNPRRYPDYLGKLREMSAAAHAGGGLWIAPAAPGFDARMIGGKSTVPRRNGATLRTELAAALGSSPDAVGLISWNEFSENSHVEPSRRYGRRALEVLAKARGAKPPAAPEVDSSDPGPASSGNRNGVPLAGGLAVLILAGLAVLGRRNRRRHGALP